MALDTQGKLKWFTRRKTNVTYGYAHSKCLFVIKYCKIEKMYYVRYLVKDKYVTYDKWFDTLKSAKEYCRYTSLSFDTRVNTKFYQNSCTTVKKYFA